ERRAESIARRDASLRANAGPLSERLRCGGTEDMQISTRELEANVARVDLGSRHGPDDWLSRAVPPNEHRAGRCGVSEPIGVHAERASRVTVPRPPASEEGREADGHVLRET